MLEASHPLLIFASIHSSTFPSTTSIFPYFILRNGDLLVPVALICSRTERKHLPSSVYGILQSRERKRRCFHDGRRFRHEEYNKPRLALQSSATAARLSGTRSCLHSRSLRTSHHGGCGIDEREENLSRFRNRARMPGAFPLLLITCDYVERRTPIYGRWVMQGGVVNHVPATAFSEVVTEPAFRSLIERSG